MNIATDNVKDYVIKWQDRMKTICLVTMGFLMGMTITGLISYYDKLDQTKIIILCVLFCLLLLFVFKIDYFINDMWSGKFKIIKRFDVEDLRNDPRN